MEDCTCPLCNSYSETTNHCLLQCSLATSVWNEVLNWWNIRGAISAKFIDWFNQWNSLAASNRMYIPWLIIFFITTWSIWWRRNKMIFENKLIPQSQLIDSIKIRSLEIIRIKFPKVLINLSDWFCFPLFSTDGIPSCGRIRATNQPLLRWEPPPSGSFKFNIDGSSFGKPGPSGSGGVLRNDSGMVLCVFHQHLGIMDSNEAEFLAIIKAVEIYSSSHLRYFPLQIESDSVTAITWCLSKASRPWKWWKTFNKLDHLLAIIPSASFINVPRSKNAFADSLARKGATNENHFLAWI